MKNRCSVLLAQVTGIVRKPVSKTRWRCDADACVTLSSVLTWQDGEDSDEFFDEYLKGQMPDAEEDDDDDDEDDMDDDDDDDLDDDADDDGGDDVCAEEGEQEPGQYGYGWSFGGEWDQNASLLVFLKFHTNLGFAPWSRHFRWERSRCFLRWRRRWRGGREWRER